MLAQKNQDQEFQDAIKELKNVTKTIAELFNQPEKYSIRELIEYRSSEQSIKEILAGVIQTYEDLSEPGFENKIDSVISQLAHLSELCVDYQRWFNAHIPSAYADLRPIPDIDTMTPGLIKIKMPASPECLSQFSALQAQLSLVAKTIEEHAHPLLSIIYGDDIDTLTNELTEGTDHAPITIARLKLAAQQGHRKLVRFKAELYESEKYQNIEQARQVMTHELSILNKATSLTSVHKIFKCLKNNGFELSNARFALGLDLDTHYSKVFSSLYENFCEQFSDEIDFIRQSHHVFIHSEHVLEAYHAISQLLQNIPNDIELMTFEEQFTLANEILTLKQHLAKHHTPMLSGFNELISQAQFLLSSCRRVLSDLSEEQVPQLTKDESELLIPEITVSSIRRHHLTLPPKANPYQRSSSTTPKINESALSRRRNASLRRSAPNIKRARSFDFPQFRSLSGTFTTLFSSASSTPDTSENSLSEDAASQKITSEYEEIRQCIEENPVLTQLKALYDEYVLLFDDVLHFDENLTAYSVFDFLSRQPLDKIQLALNESQKIFTNTLHRLKIDEIKSNCTDLISRLNVQYRTLCSLYQTFLLPKYCLINGFNAHELHIEYQLYITENDFRKTLSQINEIEVRLGELNRANDELAEYSSLSESARDTHQLMTRLLEEKDEQKTFSELIKQVEKISASLIKYQNTTQAHHPGHEEVRDLIASYEKESEFLDLLLSLDSSEEVMRHLESKLCVKNSDFINAYYRFPGQPDGLERGILFNLFNKFEEDIHDLLKPVESIYQFWEASVSFVSYITRMALQKTGDLSVKYEQDDTVDNIQKKYVYAQVRRSKQAMMMISPQFKETVSETYAQLMRLSGIIGKMLDNPVRLLQPISTLLTCFVGALSDNNTVPEMLDFLRKQDDITGSNLLRTHAELGTPQDNYHSLLSLIFNLNVQFDSINTTPEYAQLWASIFRPLMGMSKAVLQNDMTARDNICERLKHALDKFEQCILSEAHGSMKNNQAKLARTISDSYFDLITILSDIDISVSSKHKHFSGVLTKIGTCLTAFTEELSRLIQKQLDSQLQTRPRQRSRSFNPTLHARRYRETTD